jgi:divalent metal cation (Fe/Co/Zn/Cd) transporter
MCWGWIESFVVFVVACYSILSGVENTVQVHKTVIMFGIMIVFGVVPVFSNNIFTDR